MRLMSVLGIRPPQPGDDTLADRAIRAAVSAAHCAHEMLRENIRHDPQFAGTICRALGCAHPDCVAPLGAIEARVNQIPKVVSAALGGSAQVLPFPID
jgi:hypothetical protein